MATYAPFLSPRVLSDALAPRMQGAARTAVLVTAGAAFVGLLAQISFHIPGTPVPVTLQTFGVLLAGAALGWRQALGSMALYAAAGVAGVPWFTGHTSGITATFGYIVGFAVAAVVVGWLAQRGGDRTMVPAFLLMVLGTLLVYAVGVPWLAVRLDISFAHALAIGARPFLVADVLKSAVAALALPLAWRAVRRPQA